MNPANYLIPMLDLYCEWLNQWSLDSDGPEGHTYTIHQFTITDADRGLYGDARVCGIVPHVMYDGYMVVALVSDGDEGGPTELTAWFELNPDNTSYIRDMVQGFDTSRQFIVRDGQRTNLPA